MSHRTATPPEAREDPILDAARATVLDFGVRRTTVIEVARRAGVSRMTVYRRYPDAGALLRAVMTREFGQVLEAAAVAQAGEPDARARIVAEVRQGLGELIDHPVLRRLLEVDAELLLPYVTERAGRFQQLAIARLAAGIADGQRDGTIRAGDPELLATTLELALRGPVIAAGPVSESAERDALLDEVAGLVDRYLRP